VLERGGVLRFRANPHRPPVLELFRRKPGPIVAGFSQHETNFAPNRQSPPARGSWGWNRWVRPIMPDVVQAALLDRCRFPSPPLFFRPITSTPPPSLPTPRHPPTPPPLCRFPLTLLVRRKFAQRPQVVHALQRSVEGSKLDAEVCGLGMPSKGPRPPNVWAKS